MIEFDIFYKRLAMFRQQQILGEKSEVLVPPPNLYDKTTSLLKYFTTLKIEFEMIEVISRWTITIVFMYQPLFIR